ncbi:MAG: nucleotidyltransferase domain-containing protein [Bacillota bacterium]|nr:nucleotidyltransferase domain-containing protein [Bacillota bacterium]
MLANKKVTDTTALKLLNEIEYHLKRIYGTKLKKIILFGSYARNDQNKESDMDIMILLDASDDEIKQYREQVLDMVVDLTTRYGIVISTIENNAAYFYNWVEDIPFFSKVQEEGVEIYG